MMLRVSEACAKPTLSAFRSEASRLDREAGLHRPACFTICLCGARLLQGRGDCIGSAWGPSQADCP